jgi:hypothetical protein
MANTGRLDPESGLYLQPLVEMLLAREVGRSKRYTNPLAVVYLGLCLPNNPGPDVLISSRQVAATALHAALREVDIPGHYQGNYLVAMPETDSEGARKAAIRLVGKIQGNHATRDNVTFALSACAGIAAHPGGDSIVGEELLSQVAAALWEAEKRGPQNVILFSDIGDPSFSSGKL